MKIDFNELENKMPGSYKSGSTIGEVVQRLLPLAYMVAGILLLIYIVFGGYQLMTSGGDPGKTAQAKDKITSGLIGFFIVFLSYWIVQGIALILGLGNVQKIFGV